jgi:hypothetical protein
MTAAPSYSRQPRFQILINGVVMPGVQEATWQQANAYQCATFSFTKALLPGGNETFNAVFWANVTSKVITCEIKAAVDNTGFTSMIIGQIDGHAYDPIANTIQANGRDLAAVFIDARILTSYRNNTSSEIVALLAKEHPSITATVITKTTTLAGRYYDASSDISNTGDFSSAVTEWDLICLLGQKEGIIPYFIGSTLYFQSPPAQPVTFNIYCNRDANGLVTSNAESIQLNRALTFAKNVEVFVQSWDAAKKTKVVGHAITKTIKQIPGDTTPPAQFYFEFPNLTKAQADVAAQREALDIAAHERTATFGLPGDVTITPQTLIQLTGTGTDYDVLWYPTTVTRTLNMQGFSTQIEAKNSSPLTLYDGATGAAIPILQSPPTQDAY